MTLRLLRSWKTAAIAVLGTVLLSVVAPAQAEDVDLFNQPPAGGLPAPNILFILDNTANWSRASQHWVGSSTAGDAEILAIKNFVAGLTRPANVGLMEFTTAGQTGGYVRFGIRDMTVSANSTAFQNVVAGISVNGSSEKVNQSSGDIANTLYEAWLYLTGANASWAGMDGNADYANNTSTLTASRQGLSSGYAYKGSSARSGYNTPLNVACAKTFIIFIGNNGPAASPDVPGASDPASQVLANNNYTTTPDIQSAWTRFLRLRPDLQSSQGASAAANGAVVTYTIDAYNAQQSTSYTTILKNMAQEGGGKYYQAGSDTSLQSSLQNILTQIQAVNSVFASASLPVSVSVRGTYLNQVYLGVFRPDASAQPNWTGNLKQYQLGVDTTVSPPSVFLADKTGAAAENPTTGFVNPSVTSFWTQASTFWDPLYYVTTQGVGGSSDAPDGDLVEKGGAAQYLRATFATGQSARNVYTCVNAIGSCIAGQALSGYPFTTANTAITATSLAASSSEVAPIINWMRGANANLDDPANASSSTANVRGYLHGDVLHSRPAVINYNRNTDDVVIFYGANDGYLHAVKGGQDTTNSDGSELWAFVAPEHFPFLKRMRDHSPTISSTTTKPYFIDGSPTTYTVSTFNDGKIDYTRGDKAYLFVPMRRGGRFIYAFDVSNPVAPKFLWKRSSGDTGFSELGQTWSDMKVTKLRYQANPVLVFGLGYDAGANDPFTRGTATMGRGVAVVDALTGTMLWQAGPSPAGALFNKTVTGMTAAIPASVVVYDSNRDGIVDRFYAVDTAANLWRINVDDALPSNWTVNQVASLGGTGTDARKFLFPPDVVPADTSNNFDTLLIGSGDREHPLDTTIQNRYYMIKDNHGLNAVPSAVITEGAANAASVTSSQLYDATADLAQVGTSAQQAAATSAMAAAAGWYVRLGTGEKVVDGSITLNGSVFFGTNTPTAAATNSCVGNLGESRLYSLNYLNAASTIDHNKDGILSITDRSVVRAGGGFPPTPVPVSVMIGGKNYQAAISGTQVITAPGTQLNRRYKTYWQRLIDKL